MELVETGRISHLKVSIFSLYLATSVCLRESDTLRIMLIGVNNLILSYLSPCDFIVADVIIKGLGVKFSETEAYYMLLFVSCDLFIHSLIHFLIYPIIFTELICAWHKSAKYATVDQNKRVPILRKWQDINIFILF
jgi:hypothetical protein